MHRKKLITKLASGSAVAVLALGAAACDDAGDDAAPGQEAPEDGFEGEGDLEGDDGLEGEDDVEGDIDGAEDDF